MSRDDWGTISDEVFDLAERRAEELKTDVKWRSADWASIEPFTDPKVLEQLRELAEKWPTSTPDHEASSPDRVAERAVVGRIVPIGYQLGRMLMGTSEQLLEWSSEESEALLEEFDWIVSDAEYTLMLPDLGLGLIEEA